MAHPGESWNIVKSRKKEKRCRSKWEEMNAESCKEKDNETVNVKGGKERKEIKGGKNKQAVSSNHNHSPHQLAEEGDCLEAVGEIELVCLPKWTGELISKVPRDKLKDEYNLKSYLEGRLRKREFQMEIPMPPKKEKTKKKGKVVNQPPKPPQVAFGSHELISTKLCLASVALYVRNRDLASNELTQCRAAINRRLGNVSKNHTYTYKYLINSLEWSISALMPEARKKKKDYPDPQLLEEHLKNLQEDWEKVKAEMESMAVLYYMRGCLCKVIGTDDLLVLSKFKKAAEMEPGFYLWHQLIYENIRRIRKLEGKEVAPREDEMVACRKAYDLAIRENKEQVTLDLAMMRKEKLRFQTVEQIGRNEAKEEGAAIVQLFKEVIDNPFSSPVTIKNAYILMAEMYTLKGLQMEADEGKDIFLECYARWPKDGHVLHKVAKFYHYGLRGGQFQDMQKAREIYKEGMEASPLNFPCLMDYLKLVGRFEPDLSQIIDLIDHYRNFQNDNPERMVKLLTLRGLCYWLRESDAEKDKMRAAEDWVEALVNYPRLWGSVTDTIQAKKNEILGPIDIKLKDVIRYVRKYCRQREIKRLGSIDDFISEFEDLIK